MSCDCEEISNPMNHMSAQMEMWGEVFQIDTGMSISTAEWDKFDPRLSANY